MEMKTVIDNTGLRYAKPQFNGLFILLDDIETLEQPEYDCDDNHNKYDSARSEERRVGKECSDKGAACQSQTQKFQQAMK